jgi:hypothetical protein
MPYPRKPDYLKRMAGSRQPRSGSRVELPRVEALPPPPDWLDEHAVREWRRVGPILITANALSEGSLSAFAMLCALHGRLVQLFAADLLPPASLVAQWRALANDFGLTALGQQKLEVPAATVECDNPFAALRECDD